MIIQKDIITFEASDIGLLSLNMQSALKSYVGSNIAPEVFLSQQVNQQLQTALKISAKPSIDSGTNIAVTYAQADPATQQLALPLLQQAAAILGLTYTTVAPAAQVVAASPLVQHVSALK